VVEYRLNFKSTQTIHERKITGEFPDLDLRDHFFDKNPILIHRKQLTMKSNMIAFQYRVRNEEANLFAIVRSEDSTDGIQVLGNNQMTNWGLEDHEKHMEMMD
jgi:hypothetical protein